MATHSSILAWRIPGVGEPGGLPSMGSHRVGHDWSDLAAAARENSLSLPQWLWVGASAFCFQTQAQNYPIGITGSGLLSFRNPMSQFLIINLFILSHTNTHMHTYISCCSCFSAEPWWPHQLTSRHSCDGACPLSHVSMTASMPSHPGQGRPPPDMWVQSSPEESRSCVQPKLQSHRPTT